MWLDTIDGLALRKVAILLAGEQRIPVATHNALNEARRDVEEKTLGHLDF